MADFQSVKSHFDANNLSYSSFYPKSEKPMKAVIRHLPQNTPAEDKRDWLVSLGFDVISVKQVTTTIRSPFDGSTTINLPLFLIILPRTTKSKKFSDCKAPATSQSEWRHIEVKMLLPSAATASSSATFRQIASNLPAACGAEGGHMHKECPEKENTSSTPTCYNCRLAEGENPHPASYRGCRHAKDEMQKKKHQRTPRTTTGRLISSKLTTPVMSFAAALRGKTEEQQQP
jgi:hypothetical protein